MPPRRSELQCRRQRLGERRILPVSGGGSGSLCQVCEERYSLQMRYRSLKLYHGHGAVSSGSSSEIIGSQRASAMHRSLEPFTSCRASRT